MTSTAIAPRQAAAALTEYWSPRVIGELDNSYLKVAKVLGTFGWHSHDDEDELFLVLAGHLRIELEAGAVELDEGELFVVPRGVRHNPVATAEGLFGGVLVGGAIGLVGPQLTRFEVDPPKGDCYVPNAWIGALLTVLLLGWLAWRLMAAWPQLQHAQAGMQAQPMAYASSPLTMLVIGLLIGYYIVSYSGVLIHHQRFVLSRFTGENFLDKSRPKNAFDALFMLTVLMSLLVYAIAIPFFLNDYTSLPLSVGILAGLMWMPLSWIIRHWIGIAHALVRTVMVLAAWYLFPA